VKKMYTVKNVRDLLEQWDLAEDVIETFESEL